MSRSASPLVSAILALPLALGTAIPPAFASTEQNPNETLLSNLSVEDRLKAEYQQLKDSGFSEEDLRVSQLVIQKSTTSAQPNQQIEAVVDQALEESDSTSADTVGISKEQVAGDSSVITVKLSEDLSTDTQAEVIESVLETAQQQGIALESVEPDYYAKTADSFSSSAPADPSLFALATSADATLSSPTSTPAQGIYASRLWHLSAINAQGAWSAGFTGKGQQVGIVDTGIDSYHPALRSSLTPGYDFVSLMSIVSDGNGRDPNPLDTGNGSALANFHGTHVNGIASSSKTTALAFNAKSQHAKALDWGAIGTGTDIADGMLWLGGASVPGVPDNPNPSTVINASLVVPGSTCPTYFKNAIDTNHRKGIPTVVAAGNSGLNAWNYSPANCWGTIVVGASDYNTNRASFSNYGTALDIFAPGVGIWSTMNTGVSSYGSSSYGYKDGTSMATPQVAGTIALMKEAFPSMTVEQARSYLRKSATRSVGGVPFLNTGKAVAMAKANAPKTSFQVINGMYGHYSKNPALYGTPTANERATSSGGAVQTFSTGYRIYWYPHFTGALHPHTGIGSFFFANGAENGYLGYPMGNEYAVAGGFAQDFYKNGTSGRKNVVFWNASNGFTTAISPSTGIGSFFFSRGGVSAFGVPTSHEYQVAPGIYQQDFAKTNGARTSIVWSNYTGSASINPNGGIVAKWRSLGIQQVGAPTTHEYSIRGAVAQDFRNATGYTRTFFWNDTYHNTNWLNAYGEIKRTWLNKGGAQGQYGNLISDESGIDGTNAYAFFRKGSNTYMGYWSSQTGRTVFVGAGTPLYNYWRSHKTTTGYPVENEVVYSNGSRAVKMSTGVTLYYSSINGTVTKWYV